MQKQRFKHPDFNKAYWKWVMITPREVEGTLHPGSNRDQAFRDGYVGYKCKYQRNWILYPIYVAGKEWEKVNSKNMANAPTTTDEKVRFYFNFLTGQINHTGNNTFLLNEQWKFIGIFYSFTELSSDIEKDTMKWVIKKWKNYLLSYSLTESEIKSYKKSIAERVLKTLTR